jgi:hypothetical protein
MALAALLISIATFIFTATTWWYREWTRVRVAPVLLMRVSDERGSRMALAFV